MTPADELHAAATKLRETAAEDERYTAIGGSVFGAVPPAVALPLADWFDVEADVIHQRTMQDGHGEYAVDIAGDCALAVARALGGV